MRKIVVDGIEYLYLIGSYDCVIQQVGNPKKYIVSLDQITPVSYTQLERGRWKKTSSGMITPRMIAEYIKKDKTRSHQ
jgi:hypothetical protein